MYLTIMHVLMSDTILGLGMHQLKKPELLDHETYILVVLVIQLCLTLCDPMDCSPPGSSIYGDSSGKNTGVGSHGLLQWKLPDPGIEPGSLALQVDSLPCEPPGTAI